MATEASMKEARSSASPGHAQESHAQESHAQESHAQESHAEGAPAQRSREQRSREQRSSLPWVQLLPLLGLAVSVVVSALYGFPTGLIVIGATLLLVGIWNLWVSLQIAAGDHPPEAQTADIHSRSHEQEQKAFLLHALEDLEYERSVGKIDDHDYEALRQTYRKRAKEALSARNERPARKKAEALATAYIENKKGAPQTPEESPEKTTDEAADEAAERASREAPEEPPKNQGASS